MRAAMRAVIRTVMRAAFSSYFPLVVHVFQSLISEVAANISFMNFAQGKIYFPTAER